ncbi:MAG TPA: nucleotidyltransferase domain-containing protein [Gallionella sp.]|nr:nucleotidyltransferase domain-containing protein [Gallionella sp.]
MRITPHQKELIVRTAREVFGDDVEVRLFGSRADDSKKGGDIDLFIDAHGAISDKEKKTTALASKIAIGMGDVIPVDVIVKDDETEIKLIHREGMKGLLL